MDRATGEVRLRGRRRELALLAFLSRRAPRSVPRTLLAELLWGNKDEDRGRASLRQALSQLRAVLGDALETPGDDVALAAGAIELDAMQFDEDAAAARWSEAVARWNGDFLAGTDDVGGEAYREWVDAERARLRRIAERALASLVDEQERRETWTDAATTARRWCELFPDDPRASTALTRVVDRLATMEKPVTPTVVGDPPDDNGSTGGARPTRRWIAYAVGAMAMAVVVAGASLTRETFGRSESRGRAVDERPTILVPDFRAVGTDSVLGIVAGGAMRVALGQSRALAVFPPTAIQEALTRLKPDAVSPPDLTTLREVAARAGVKAVVDGQLLSSGDQFLLSARLVGTVSGDELGHYSEVAPNRDALLAAVDRLAADLRRGAGEPLRAVEDTRAVERVTTTSLEAYTKYLRGTRALDLEGAPARGMELLKEAIALDSTFAMANRRLAVELDGRGGHDALIRELVERAYAYRARLTDPERYAVEAAYYSYGPTPDEDKAIAAYEAALEAEPRFGLALINLGNIYNRRRRFSLAESLFTRAIELRTSTVASHSNLAHVQIQSGKLDAAAQTIAHFELVSPGNQRATQARADLLYARGMHDSAAAILRAVVETSTDLARRQSWGMYLRDIALVRGRLAEARRWSQVSSDARQRREARDGALVGALDDAWIALWFRHDTVAALRATATALERQPLSAIEPLDRPYGTLIQIYSWAGRPALAKAALAGWDSATGGRPRINARTRSASYRGEIALAERRYADAIDDFHAADSLSCATCILPLLAIAHAGAGASDSALALFTRFVETPDYDRSPVDAAFLPLALRWLAEAEQRRGNADRAAAHVNRLAKLWAAADPELQAEVAVLRRRLVPPQLLTPRR